MFLSGAVSFGSLAPHVRSAHVREGERGFLPEVKLMTLREMFPFVRFRIGGLVVSRSVKYLGEKRVRILLSQASCVQNAPSLDTSRNLLFCPRARFLLSPWGNPSSDYARFSAGFLAECLFLW